MQNSLICLCSTLGSSIFFLNGMYVIWNCYFQLFYFKFMSNLMALRSCLFWIIWICDYNLGLFSVCNSRQIYLFIPFILWNFHLTLAVCQSHTCARIHSPRGNSLSWLCVLCVLFFVIWPSVVNVDVMVFLNLSFVTDFDWVLLHSFECFVLLWWLCVYWQIRLYFSAYICMGWCGFDVYQSLDSSFQSYLNGHNFLFVLNSLGSLSLAVSKITCVQI